ncbi:MAG: hypothetical protein ACLP6E_12940 [Acidimicrobiales bacterium]
MVGRIELVGNDISIVWYAAPAASRCSRVTLRRPPAPSPPRPLLGVEGPDALDPVRIQKGIFLLSERGPAQGVYQFRPYNWGPFSPALYGDLDLLCRLGYLKTEQVPGRTWKRYSVTLRGRASCGLLRTIN